MRYSSDHKSETRARIVQNTAVRLREQGPEGVGVADVMKDAGLTHGGFYAHFKSREALIGEALVFAMNGLGSRWQQRAEAAPAGQQLEAVVNGYLTTQHRDDIGGGCMLPALSADIARGSAKARKAFSARLEKAVEMVAGFQSQRSTKAARRDAMAAISTMMGSLLLARAVGDSELSSELLEAGRFAALRSRTVQKKAAEKKAVRKKTVSKNTASKKTAAKKPGKSAAAKAP